MGILESNFAESVRERRMIKNDLHMWRDMFYLQTACHHAVALPASSREDSPAPWSPHCRRF